MLKASGPEPPGPSGSGGPGHSNLAAMSNSALVRAVRCLGVPVKSILTDSVTDALAEAGQSRYGQPEKYLNSLLKVPGSTPVPTEPQHPIY